MRRLRMDQFSCAAIFVRYRSRAIHKYTDRQMCIGIPEHTNSILPQQLFIRRVRLSIVCMCSQTLANQSVTLILHVPHFIRKQSHQAHICMNAIYLYRQFLLLLLFAASALNQSKFLTFILRLHHIGKLPADTKINCFL